MYPFIHPLPLCIYFSIQRSKFSYPWHSSHLQRWLVHQVGGRWPLHPPSPTAGLDISKHKKTWSDLLQYTTDLFLELFKRLLKKYCKSATLWCSLLSPWFLARDVCPSYKVSGWKLVNYHHLHVRYIHRQGLVCSLVSRLFVRAKKWEKERERLGTRLVCMRTEHRVDFYFYWNVCTRQFWNSMMLQYKKIV